MYERKNVKESIIKIIERHFRRKNYLKNNKVKDFLIKGKKKIIEMNYNGVYYYEVDRVGRVILSYY